MSYRLVYAPAAERDLERVPPALLDLVEHHMLRLATNPAALSRPSAFPYPPDCQLYQFDHDYGDGRRHVFAVLFRYGADEQSLRVLGIGHGEVTSI
jgi:hypothetical protein